MVMGVEVVRGGIPPARAEQLLQLWSRHGVLDGDDARARLADVVCVLVDDADDVVGACSVYDTPVPLIGNRRFWVYRRFLAPSASGDEDSESVLFNAAFDALESNALESGALAAGGGPLGLCVPILDADRALRPRDAVWPATGLLHAGFLADRTQVRIRYFAGARVI